MKILINSFEPRLNEQGVPDSYEWQNKLFYPYVVTFTLNGQQLQGEASVVSTPPWWEVNNTYDCEVIPDQKKPGGNKLRITRPQQSHTGGSRFYGQSSSQPQSYQQPQQTQQAPPQPSGPSKDDYRQALIVSQTSMKCAVEYIPTLSEEARSNLMTELKTEVDLVTSFAKKIAKETFNIANSLIDSMPPF